MRNRTKKRQKAIDDLIGLVLVISALGGWYLTKSLKGMGIIVAITFGIMIVIGRWQSARFNKRLKESGVADIDRMTGSQFEEYVGALFASQGYSVKHTPATGDYGADVVLKKGQDVIVVQAKRYKSTVGVKAVQEVIPAIKMYKATDAWVITNSTYTKQALTLARHNQVRMIDRDELIQMGINLRNSKKQKDFNQSEQSIETSDQLLINVEANKLTNKVESMTAATLEVDSVNISANKLEMLLKEYRLKKSRQSGMKAFHIFTNKTLDELVEVRPVTIHELRKIRGIGEKKIADFGEELVKVIRDARLG